jgi:nitroreductase
MLDTIFSHRSIRKFREAEVDNNTLNTILSAGTRASTTGNMQVYSMVITRDESIRKQLWECHFRQDMVLQAPLHITFCADFNRFNKWCRQRKATPGYDNYLSFFTAAVDALLVSQNVCLAAENMGLGICYLGTVTYNARRIIDILRLPRGVVPVAAIVAGYPGEEPGLTDRLPLEGVIHNERYQDYSAEDIDNIYADRESQEKTLELLEINRKETLAQIFTDNRYKKEDNLHFSREFLEVLKMQGFMNHD